MSVPAGWQTQPLKKVLLKTSNVDPRKTPDEEFEYIDVSSVCRKTFCIVNTTRMLGKEAPSRARRQVETNDVLFATIRPTLQRIAVIPDELDGEICSTGYVVLRPSDEIDNKFLYYYLFTKPFMEEMEKRQKGASYPAVNDGDVKNRLIPFPSVLEQRRIVAILDDAFERIDTAIANTEKNLANARELFESYLNNVFTQKGVGWEEMPVRDISHVVCGHSFKSGDFSDSHEVRAIKIANVGVRTFVDDPSNTLPKDFLSLHAKFSIPSGSIVIALTRSIIAAGLKVALVPDEYDRALLNQRVAAVIATPDVVLRDFLYYFLCSSEVVDYVKRKANTLMQPNLSVTDLKKLPVPLPPLSVQKQIVEKIKVIGDASVQLEHLYQKKLDALTELKQSILQKAFAGELTDEVKHAELAN